eukprot:19612-Eustigmatos_ZCMA.PRE.1
MACLNSYIKIRWVTGGRYRSLGRGLTHQVCMPSRVDVWRMTQIMRRPEPRTAEDIGGSSRRQLEHEPSLHLSYAFLW